MPISQMSKLRLELKCVAAGIIPKAMEPRIRRPQGGGGRARGWI